MSDGWIILDDGHECTNVFFDWRFQEKPAHTFRLIAFVTYVLCGSKLILDLYILRPHPLFLPYFGGLS